VAILYYSIIVNIFMADNALSSLIEKCASAARITKSTRRLAIVVPSVCEAARTEAYASSRTSADAITATRDATVKLVNKHTLPHLAVEVHYTAAFYLWLFYF
jgi:hypothetical protein